MIKNPRYKLWAYGIGNAFLSDEHQVSQSQQKMMPRDMLEWVFFGYSKFKDLVQAFCFEIIGTIGFLKSIKT